MIMFAKVGIGAALAALLLFLVTGTRSASAETLFGKAALTIEASTGPVTFTIEVADSDAKRSQGLMFRKTLGDREGMLFLFDQEQTISMWMKNTYIALDMVFIGADWRIVHVAQKTEPFSLDIVGSNLPASRVLEIAGGSAAAAGLKVGDRVRYPG